MDRAIQPGLMIFGCAALVITAVLLPAVILRPADHVEPAKEIPGRQTRVAETPVSQPPVIQAPVIQLPVAQTPATQIPVTQTPVARTPSARTRAARTAAAQAPVTQAPVIEAPATQTETTNEGDGASRGQSFRIVMELGKKKLGPEAALSSSLDLNFSFPHTRTDAIFGIDVSHHNVNNCGGCPLNWDLLASKKVAFVYLKASEGIAHTDGIFAGQWRALAQRPKIHRGAYHWLRGDVSIERQADIFVEKIGKLQPGDLPPAVDLEWDWFVDSTRNGRPRDGYDYWSNLDPDEIIDKALTFVRLVEKKTGRIPVIYTSHEWWVQRKIDVKKIELFKRYPLWLASYANEDLRLEKPGAKNRWADQWRWTLWQFTNMGDLTKAGIPNPKNPKTERMDVSLYSGSLEEFQQELGIAATIEVVRKDTPTTPAPGGSATSGQTPGGGAVAPSEPPKETQVAVTPGTDSNKPGESNTTNTPAASGGAVPPTEPPKETQVAVTPGTDSNKPGESNTTNTPAAGGGAVPPSEPPKETPKETPVASIPGTEGNASKPGDSNAANNPATAGGTVPPNEPPPKETQTASVPGPEGNAGKPGDSAAANNPAAGSGAIPPTEPPKEAQVASIPGATNGGDSGTNAGSGSKDLPLNAPSQKTTVEIVLKNGRIIRVDASIDPVVLRRLIALLEGQ